MLLLACWLGLALGATQARAQEPVRLAVLQTGSDDVSQQELASAIDPVLLSELAGISIVQVASRPALDLPALALAIDCVGQSVHCLRSASEQAGSEGLIAPSLRQVGSETMLTLLYFDGRGDGTMRQVTRRFETANVEQPALDAIPEMVREALGLPPDAPATAAPNIAPSAVTLPRVTQDEEGDEPPSDALPVVPIVITSVGVAVATTGVVFGLAANNSEENYKKIAVTDARSAQRAKDKRDTGKQQALLGNVMLGVGGAAVATGVVLWVLDATGNKGAGAADEDDEGVSLSPKISPKTLGFSLSGRF